MSGRSYPDSPFEYPDGRFGREVREIEAARIQDMTFPVRCTSCNRIYDLGKLTEYGRYTDCTTWRCPGCKISVSDRPHAWGHDHHYVELDRATGRVRSDRDGRKV